MAQWHKAIWFWTEEVVTDSEPVFFITEQIFCLYFFLELVPASAVHLFEISDPNVLHVFLLQFCETEVIRFLAFKSKLNCFRDAWFVFDLLLVVTMILVTCLKFSEWPVETTETCCVGFFIKPALHQLLLQPRSQVSPNKQTLGSCRRCRQIRCVLVVVCCLLSLLSIEYVAYRHQSPEFTEAFWKRLRKLGWWRPFFSSPGKEVLAVFSAMHQSCD